MRTRTQRTNNYDYRITETSSTRPMSYDLYRFAVECNAYVVREERKQEQADTWSNR